MIEFFKKKTIQGSDQLHLSVKNVSLGSDFLDPLVFKEVLFFHSDLVQYPLSLTEMSKFKETKNNLLKHINFYPVSVSQFCNYLIL